MEINRRIIIQLSEDDKSDIAKMYREGKNTSEIAEYIGCSRTTVYYHLRKIGLVGGIKWTDAMDDFLVEQYRLGRTRKEISRSIDISAKRVTHRIGYLRKLGKL